MGSSSCLDCTFSYGNMSAILSAQSKLRNGDLEWFFFCSKSKKYSSGSRTNRATEAGYWKATGKDKEVKYQNRTVAKRKTLVFHLDHPPNGKRTDWVMHEYRMEDKDLDPGVVQGAYVICRVFKKSGAGPQNGAQYGAPFEEEDWDADEVDCSEPSAAVGQSGVMETWNLNASSSAVTNMISTEPGPSTVTCENHNKTSTVTCLALVGLSGDTRAPDPRPSSSYVMNMKSTEPGPSTMPTNDDGFTNEEIVSIYHGDDTQEQEQKVEDGKGKEEDDSFFEGLDGLGLGDLDPLSNMDDFMLDTFLPADDIDAELGKFFMG